MPTASDPIPRSFNMAAHVLAAARQVPHKTALELLGADHGEIWSYGQLEAAVLGTASGLLAKRLVPGDRVLIRLGNSVDFPIVYLACLAVDLVPVPTSAHLTAPEISAIATALRPALIAAAPDIALPVGFGGPVVGLPELRRMRNASPAQYAFGDPDREGYIIFTSGTSGRPRGVVHAHRAIWARRSMIDGWYALRPSDRLLHAGAFNWTYTLGTGLMDPWAMGATALVPAPGTSAAGLPALLAQSRATIFAAAPGIYRQMLRNQLPPLPALRHGLSAGEKLPPAVTAAWYAATGRDIHEAFGMSECSTFISSAPHRPAPADSLGRAQPGRRVAILGADGPLPPDRPGTIAVAADDPGLMLGYLDDPEATAARIAQGWFLTGDTGAMAADGTITYLGRDDDIMTAGGYRVSPLEIEAVLTAFPGIGEVAVAEVDVRPDVRVIVAFYTAEQPLDDDALRGFCAARLARYKCPRAFRHRAALPRNPNGKILRRALRDAAPDL